MVCILYVIAVGTLLGIVGLLVERVLPPTTTSRRWIWCAVIAINMTIPGIYRTKHNSSVTEVLENQVVPSHLGHAVGTASLNALNDGLAARIESFNPMIRRIWLISSGMLVLWGVATAARVYFLVARSRRRSASGEPSVVDGVSVLVTDSVGPATVGVLRSRVLVPQWVLALPRVQRRYVLRHEEEHRSSRDSLLLFVASLTLILAPWNLALWWQLRRLRLAVEMDCDNRVVSALGDANAYGELLFKVAQAASRGPRLQPAFLGAGMLERRLTALVAPTPLRHVQRFLLPAAALGLLSLALSMPHPFLDLKSTAHATYSAQSPEVIVPAR
jgi:beta-lactamase regulating signal transducer with metallopeptidase domain